MKALFITTTLLVLSFACYSQAITDNGTNVGVNNAAPFYTFDVNTSGASSPFHGLRIKRNENAAVAFDFSNNQGRYLMQVASNGSFRIDDAGNSAIPFEIQLESSDYGRGIFVASNGNIGVGLTSPDSKLSVKGGMESEEVQVKQNVADYVFTDEYQIMSLEDLEVYIAENKHLPRIQTQKNVDENRGLVKLGELSVSLMEKVEELTLHLIEMNKRVKALEAENKQLREEK